MVEAQNVEVLQSGKTEYKDLVKQKQMLEIKIQSMQSMVTTLTQTSAAASHYTHTHIHTQGYYSGFPQRSQLKTRMKIPCFDT